MVILVLSDRNRVAGAEVPVHIWLGNEFLKFGERFICVPSNFSAIDAISSDIDIL